MGAIAFQISSLTIAYSTVYSDADQRKHQSPASLAFVWGIHRWPVNSPHKWPVTRKIFPFDDVIMKWSALLSFRVGSMWTSRWPLLGCAIWVWGRLAVHHVISLLFQFIIIMENINSILQNKYTPYVVGGVVVVVSIPLIKRFFL